MSACCCSLAGTAACRTCSNNPFAETPPPVRTYTVSATDPVLITGQKTNAADVAPVRHGRWKFKEDKAWVGNGKYWCSVCRYGFASGAYHKVDEFKFCPMCGAKMDGGEE